MNNELSLVSLFGDRFTNRFMGDQRGLCLTELMISLATGAAVLAAALNSLNMVQTYGGQQHRTLKHQQDLRLGLEVFEQETRLAMADSIITAAPDQFLFHANLGGYRTVTTDALLSGQSIIAVEDGRGWGEGKTIRICGPLGCESHQLARAGQRYRLTLAEPVGSNFQTGASVEVQNRVVYYTKPNAEGVMDLMRMVDGGASVLIGALEGLRLSYWGEAGEQTNQASQVKRVVLEIKSTQPLHRMVREVSIRS